MENLEQLSCTFSKELPPSVNACHYEDGLSCLITDTSLFIYSEKLPADAGKMFKIDVVDRPLRYVRYLSVYELVFVASDTQLAISNPQTEKTFIKWTFDIPIIALSWNPIQTALVVINRDLDMYLMTFRSADLEFDITYTVHLHVPAPVPISSGWAVEIAQFRGSRVKRIADVPILPAGNAIFESAPQISWRGQGEEFAVNYFKDNQRLVKTFRHDLSPIFETIPYIGLGPLVAFRYFGQTFVCFAVRNNCNDLVIFERNCRHKSAFYAEEVVGRIVKLRFHQEMNMLAVLSIGNDERMYINIYLKLEARWYLKQQMIFKPDNNVIDLQWAYLDEKAFTTCKLVVFTVQKIEYHLFRFVINRCDLEGTLLVINGRRLDVYQFANQKGPVFSSYSNFYNDVPINKVMFLPDFKSCAIVESTLLLKSITFTSLFCTERIIFEEEVSHLVDGTQFILTLNDDAKTSLGLLKLEPRTEALDLDIFFNILYSDLEDESTVMKPVKNELDKNIIYTTRRKFYFGTERVYFEFKILNNLDLYVNQNKVCKGVSSFISVEDYVVFTNVDNRIYFIKVIDKTIFDDVLDLKRFYSKQIENGAKIVHYNNLVPIKIILELPRGNLELVSCPMMTIDAIEEALDNNKWKTVFYILREEKINSNVIIDLCPERFMVNINQFVILAIYTNRLNAIIAEFNLNENCFVTCYKNYLKQPPAPFDKRLVITRIVNYLVRTDCVNNLGSVVLIHLTHNSIKAALKAIKDVFDKSDTADICSLAIKQVLISVHLNEVLTAAYSFYDLDFIRLIYQNSNEDPMVYMPGLENLRSMKNSERRFHMNVQAAEYEKALKYLLGNNTFTNDFITDFIINHNLEYVAYHSYIEDTELFKDITKCYAAYLAEDKRHREAGSILRRGQFLQEALVEFRQALDWREVILLLKQLHYSEEAKVQYLNQFAEELLSAKKGEAGLIILEYYTKNYQRGLQALIDFKEFKMAVSFCETYDLSKSDILVPALKEFMIGLMEKLETFKGQFLQYVIRLQEVRREKTLRREVTGLEDQIDDAYSEAGTSTASTSLKSGLSTLSSRNRRKELKKKMSLRRGGRFEDIALMRVLHSMYNEVINYGKGLRDLCLIEEHSVWEFCNNLQCRFQSLKTVMEMNIENIWPKEFLNPTSNDNATLTLIENKNDLDPEFCTPPIAVLQDPIWCYSPL